MSLCYSLLFLPCKYPTSGMLLHSGLVGCLGWHLATAGNKTESFNPCVSNWGRAKPNISHESNPLRTTTSALTNKMTEEHLFLVREFIANLRYFRASTYNKFVTPRDSFPALSKPQTPVPHLPSPDLDDLLTNPQWHQHPLSSNSFLLKPPSSETQPSPRPSNS